MTGDEAYDLFRRNLRDIRTELGISQSELARRMDVYPSYICDLENSRRPGITLETIAKIAEHLGIAPASLLTTVRTPHAVAR